MNANQFSSVGFPGRNLILVSDREVYRVHHDTIPCSLSRVGRLRSFSCRFQQTLIVIGIVLFMKARRQAEITELNVPFLVAGSNESGFARGTKKDT